MREIKFRAWDKNKQKMFYFNMHPKETYVDNLVIFGDGSWVFQNSELGEDELYTDYTMGILMQYTGLKDKQGKEIYEGDIVNNLNPVEGEEVPYKVEWNVCFGGWGLFYNADYEVIGNIYENPE